MKEDESVEENKSVDAEEDSVFLTHRETADLLRMSTNCLYRWNRLKKGPPYIKAGVGKLLYNKKDVLKYLQNCKQ